jgi:cyclophilin family peptidyl-prolyl cis-trans isomerase
MRAVFPRPVLAKAGDVQPALGSCRKARMGKQSGVRGVARRVSAIGSSDRVDMIGGHDFPTDARDVRVETNCAVDAGEQSTCTSANGIAKAAVASALAAVMALEPLAAVVGSQTVGFGVATGLATTLATASDASAALSNPNTRLPRNGIAALRRAVPGINEESGLVQSKLEEAAYLLRIPQRKPWGTMGDNVKVSLNTVRDKKEKMLAPVPVGDARDAAETTRAELEQLLLELVDIAQAQDVERFDRGVAMALDATSRLKVFQAPGLPFDVPRKFQNLPRLTGRATVELVIKKAPGTSFGYVNGDETNQVVLTIVVDGYNAPLTSGNFVENVINGVYDDVTLQKSETALLTVPKNGVDTAATLPLEVKPIDDYEPRYRSPLNVMGAEELPTLPLSVNGALAMARGAEDGTSSASQFFIYAFDKRSAGLGGMAFEEGEFSVFGYVTKGEEEGFLSQLNTGDTIVSAKVISGGERLVNGGGGKPAGDEGSAE